MALGSAPAPLSSPSSTFPSSIRLSVALRASPLAASCPRAATWRRPAAPSISGKLFELAGARLGDGLADAVPGTVTGDAFYRFGLGLEDGELFEGKARSDEGVDVFREGIGTSDLLFDYFAACRARLPGSGALAPWPGGWKLGCVELSVLTAGDRPEPPLAVFAAFARILECLFFGLTMPVSCMWPILLLYLP